MALSCRAGAMEPTPNGGVRTYEIQALDGPAGGWHRRARHWGGRRERRHLLAGDGDGLELCPGIRQQTGRDHTFEFDPNSERTEERGTADHRPDGQGWKDHPDANEREKE